MAYKKIGLIFLSVFWISLSNSALASDLLQNQENGQYDENQENNISKNEFFEIFKKESLYFLESPQRMYYWKLKGSLVAVNAAIFVIGALVIPIIACRPTEACSSSCWYSVCMVPAAFGSLAALTSYVSRNIFKSDEELNTRCNNRIKMAKIIGNAYCYLQGSAYDEKILGDCCEIYHIEDNVFRHEKTMLKFCQKIVAANEAGYFIPSYALLPAIKLQKSQGTGLAHIGILADYQDISDIINKLYRCTMKQMIEDKKNLLLLNVSKTADHPVIEIGQ